jgi:uncharacterized protein YaaR (DUF327 family)
MNNIIINTLLSEKLYKSVDKIYEILKKITESGHSTVNKKINELDLKSKIEEVEGLFIDIEKDAKLKGKQSILNSLKSIHEIVNKIHICLENITDKIIEHENKWFNYWRDVEFYKELEELETNEKILISRYNRLKDLLKINWN